MSSIKFITATFLAASLFSGCSVISQANNAKAGYQAYQSYQTAKSMRGAEAVFTGADQFAVSAKLMPRDESLSPEIHDAFTQVVQENTESLANELGLDLVSCTDNCPMDAVRVQFKEKGREGFVDKVALGSVIGGDMYVTQHGEVLEEYTLEMSEDYAQMAQTLSAALSVRLMKTVQENIQAAYSAGEISEEEMEEQSELLVDAMNKKVQLEGPLYESLKNKA